MFKFERIFNRNFYAEESKIELVNDSKLSKTTKYSLNF